MPPVDFSGHVCYGSNLMDLTTVTTVVKQIVVELGPTFKIWGPILAILCWFWATQFIQLMIMADRDFPGTRDKLNWGLAFLVLPFVVPFVFWGWKLALMKRIEHHPDGPLEPKLKDHRKRTSLARFQPSRN